MRPSRVAERLHVAADFVESGEGPDSPTVRALLDGIPLSGITASVRIGLDDRMHALPPTHPVVRRLRAIATDRLLTHGDRVGHTTETRWAMGCEISLDRWLDSYLPECDEFSDAFAEYEDDDARDLFEMTHSFLESRGFTCATRDNVANNEHDFDTVFVWEVWYPEDDCPDDWFYGDDAVIVIFPHRGGDIRGNYGYPRFCRAEETDSEYVFPLTWTVGYWAEPSDTIDKHGLKPEEWASGYSSNPWYHMARQMHDAGFARVRPIESPDMYPGFIFMNPESGDFIRVSPDYYP